MSYQLGVLWKNDGELELYILNPLITVKNILEVLRFLEKVWK